MLFAGGVTLPVDVSAAQYESSAHPEAQRTDPIWPLLEPAPLPKPPRGGRKTPSPDAGPSATAVPAGADGPIDALAAASIGPNLIANPSVETAGSPGAPAQWLRGGYGTNNRLLLYPVPGYNSPNGLQVSIASYTSGDAKWFFADVPVTAGRTYQYSDAYTATVPTLLTARFRRNDGTYAYMDLGTLNASAAYATATATFVAPAGTVALTVFHLLNRVGQLRTDEFSLNEILEGPPEPENLIQNPGFETPGAAGNPLNWSRGGYGTNTRVFSYPVPGAGGTQAARVAITSYASGDAKWFFTPVSVTSGIYTYSTQYRATAPTRLTVRFQHQDNSYTYQDFGQVAPSASFGAISANFSAPATAKNATVFHLLNSVGELIQDNVALRAAGSPPGVFATGAVSLTFDDGWFSQYQYARPKLNSAGLKATFYIITRQMADDGFAGFMSRAQVRQLYQEGHEIGAHTRTHRNLTTLSAAEQQTEINGSRQDLLDMAVGSILSFAYPYGSYNSTTLQIVRGGGFTSARTSLPGTVIPTSDRHQLARFPVENTTTFGQMKQAVDAAIANKEWVIFMFHQIKTPATDQYATTVELFNQLVDYLVQQRTPVVTVSEGIKSLP